MKAAARLQPSFGCNTTLPIPMQQVPESPQSRNLRAASCPLGCPAAGTLGLQVLGGMFPGQLCWPGTPVAVALQEFTGQVAASHTWRQCHTLGCRLQRHTLGCSVTNLDAGCSATHLDAACQVSSLQVLTSLRSSGRLSTDIRTSLSGLVNPALLP